MTWDGPKTFPPGSPRSRPQASGSGHGTKKRTKRKIRYKKKEERKTEEEGKKEKKKRKEEAERGLSGKMVFGRKKGGNEGRMEVRRGKGGGKREEVEESGRNEEEPGMFRKLFPGEDLTGKMVFGRDLGGTKWAFNDENCQKLQNFSLFIPRRTFPGKFLRKDSSGTIFPFIIPV